MKESLEVVAEVDLLTGRGNEPDKDKLDPQKPGLVEGAVQAFKDLVRGGGRFEAEREEIRARHERQAEAEIAALAERQATERDKARQAALEENPEIQSRLKMLEEAEAERRAGVEVLVLLARLLKAERKKSKVTHLEINKTLGEMPSTTMPETSAALSFFLTTLTRLVK